MEEIIDRLLSIDNWDEIFNVLRRYPQLKRHPRMKEKINGLNEYVDASLIAIIAELEYESQKQI